MLVLLSWSAISKALSHMQVGEIYLSERIHHLSSKVRFKRTAVGVTTMFLFEGFSISALGLFTFVVKFSQGISEGSIWVFVWIKLANIYVYVSRE